jgi:hypothetical protein
MASTKTEPRRTTSKSRQLLIHFPCPYCGERASITAPKTQVAYRIVGWFEGHVRLSPRCRSAAERDGDIAPLMRAGWLGRGAPKQGHRHDAKKALPLPVGKPTNLEVRP